MIGCLVGMQEDGEAMPALFDLFDVAEEDFVVPSAEDTSSEEALPGRECNLDSCLAAFFSTEEVTWECPGEKAARRNSAAKSTPGVPRSVSFSGSGPCEIPALSFLP